MPSVKKSFWVAIGASGVAFIVAHFILALAFMIGVWAPLPELLVFSMVIASILLLAWRVLSIGPMLILEIIEAIPWLGPRIKEQTEAIRAGVVFLLLALMFAYITGITNHPRVTTAFCLSTLLVLFGILFGEAEWQKSIVARAEKIVLSRAVFVWTLTLLVASAFATFGRLPEPVQERMNDWGVGMRNAAQQGRQLPVRYVSEADLLKAGVFDPETGKNRFWCGCADVETGLVHVFTDGRDRYDPECKTQTRLRQCDLTDPDLLAGLQAYQQKIAEEAARRAAALPSPSAELPTVEATPLSTPAPSPTETPTPTPAPTRKPMSAAEVLAEAHALRERERERQEVAFGQEIATPPTWARVAPTPTPAPTREPDFIREGTELDITISEDFDLSLRERAISFSCVVRTEVRTTHGAIAIPKNSPCHGRVSRLWEEDGTMHAVLSIVQAGTISVAEEQIATRASSKGQNTKKRSIVGAIIGGAVGGAAGAVADGERGAKRGAAGGAGAGLAVGIATSKGPHINIKKGTAITFSFWSSVSLY